MDVARFGSRVRRILAVIDAGAYHEGPTVFGM